MSSGTAEWVVLPCLASIPAVGLLLWCLVPRLLHWMVYRYRGGVPRLRVNVPNHHDSPSAPGSPVELLPTTTAVGSFPPAHDPFPTPDNTLRRVSTAFVHPT